MAPDLLRSAAAPVWGAGCCALLAFGLYAGGAATVLVVLLVGGAGLLLASRLSLGDVGVLLACAAAFTAPWNAVLVAGLRPGDLLLLLALGCLAAAASGPDGFGWPRLPWWLLFLAAMIAVLAAVHQLAPIDADYLRNRLTLGVGGRVVNVPAQTTNLGLASRWLVSLVGVPLVIGLAARRRPAAIGWTAAAFALGAAVSGLVAVTDAAGLTAISARYVLPDFTGRQAGLTVHPNHLAAGCALAVPIACWLLSRPGGWRKLAGAAALAGCVSGIYVSGSRGGVVATALGFTLAVVLLSRLRTVLPWLGLALIIGVLGVVVVKPGLIDGVAAATRLGGGRQYTAASDEAHQLLGQQALKDMARSPVDGVGMQVALDAHNVPRQLLAAGGVLLFGAFLIFAYCLLRDGLGARDRSELAPALAAAAACWLVFGNVENLLMDRYLYVPVGLILAVTSLRSRIAEGVAA